VDNYKHSTLNLHLRVVDNQLLIKGYPQVFRPLVHTSGVAFKQKRAARRRPVSRETCYYFLPTT
jgi:hypothetical protein